MRLNTLLSLFLPMRTLLGREPARSVQLAEREVCDSGARALGRYAECAVSPVSQPLSQTRCSTGYGRLTTYSKLCGCNV